MKELTKCCGWNIPALKTFILPHQAVGRCLVCCNQTETKTGHSRSRKKGNQPFQTGEGPGRKGGSLGNALNFSHVIGWKSWRETEIFVKKKKSLETQSKQRAIEMALVSLGDQQSQGHRCCLLLVNVPDEPM